MAERLVFEKLIVRVIEKKKDEVEVFLGTAFLINNEYLLTARHVVGNKDFKSIMLKDGPWGGSSRPLGQQPIFHQSLDVALLKLTMPNNRPIKFAEFLNIDNLQGQRVKIKGFEDKDKDPPDKNEQKVLNQEPGYHSFNIEGKVPHGFSGGPVILSDKIVGMVWARSDATNPQLDNHISLIYPYSVFKDFLKESNVDISVKPDTLRTVDDSFDFKRLKVDERVALIDRKDHYDYINKRMNAEMRRKTFAFVIAGVHKEWPIALKHRWLIHRPVYARKGNNYAVDLDFEPGNLVLMEKRFLLRLLYPLLIENEQAADEKKVWDEQIDINDIRKALEAKLHDSSPLAYFFKLDRYSQNLDFILKVVLAWESLSVAKEANQHILFILHGFENQEKSLWCGVKRLLRQPEDKVEKWHKDLAKKLNAAGKPQIILPKLESPPKQDVYTWCNQHLDGEPEFYPFTKEIEAIPGLTVPHLDLLGTYQKVIASLNPKP